MFYSVTGKLTHMEEGIVVVECGGVGFKCKTTLNTQKDVKLGSEVLLYTFLNVRDDAIEIFGFSSEMELKTFEKLISVNGVGPKVGLGILSTLSPDDIALAISTADAKTLTRANGVGPKLAQRLILELKDKINTILPTTENIEASGIVTSTAGAALNNRSKAVEALSVLGYSSADVSPILSSLDVNLPVEQLINETLKRMGGK